MRHPGLDNAVDGIESDEPTHLGILDRGPIGNSGQRRQVDRPADRQRIDDVADRGWELTDPRFDQFGQAGRRGRLTGPPPLTVRLREPTVGDRLVDDVA